MTPEAVIHIACQADEAFVPECAVMLHSLLATNPEEAFDVHFLHDAYAPPRGQDDLKGMVLQMGARWSPLPVDHARMAGFPLAPFYGGYAACYRLLLPDLLPDTKRVLYLDADLLVLDRIRPLWQTELGDCCVAAVSNPLYGHMEARIQRTLGLPDRTAYFNSGVLLLELSALRTSGLGADLKRYAVEHASDVSWPDQDVLNAVLWKHRLPLHPRWNATSWLWELPDRLQPGDLREINEARSNPAIAHFIGPYKALHYRCTHPFQARYGEHLAATPWRDRAPHGRTLKHRLLRPLPPLWQWTFENGPTELAHQTKSQFVRSAPGGTARDAYRWLTPAKSRGGPIPALLSALSLSRPSVFFVQVGANDGVQGDPLRPFILSDRWRGILVEPLPQAFTRLKMNYRHRPDLVLENVAIGPRDGAAPFFGFAPSDDAAPQWSDHLGARSRDSVLRHIDYSPDLADRLVELEVQTMTFESLCAKHSVGQIDLVHIDAEDESFEIVKSIDFDVHRPWMVVHGHKHLGPGDVKACRAYLETKGYACGTVEWETVALRREALSSRWSRLARTWRLAQRMKPVAVDGG